MVKSVTNSEIGPAKIVMLGANYDGTSSFGKGASNAPRTIRQILDSQIELYERHTRICPEKISKIAYLDMGDLNDKTPEEMVGAVKGACAKLYKDGRFVITLGGEHSVSNGPLQAIADGRKGKAGGITVVQLDAHMDLREDDSDYSETPHGRYAHSAVMRRACELGYRLVEVGVRAYSEDEYNYAMKNRKSISFFEWGKCPGLFKEPALAKILSAIKTKDVYLTIDADGFDPSVMPETGTPVPGGFSWDYGVKLINKIFAERNVLGADIVEVAPKSDDSPTAYNAAQLAYSMAAQHLKKGGA
jgi:agmatinase